LLSVKGVLGVNKIIIVAVAILVGFLGYRFLGTESGYHIKNVPFEVSRIVCLGDSLTYGVGASKGLDFPSRLAEITGIEVINSGVSGNTTADALARLEADVLEYEPDVVLITLGGNDLKNRVGEGTARANLLAIIQGIQETGAMVILGGLEIPLYGKGFSKMYRSLARQTGTVLIPNILEDIFGRRGMMSDPIHPNNKGYEIMTGYFHQALLPYIRS